MRFAAVRHAVCILGEHANPSLFVVPRRRDVVIDGPPTPEGIAALLSEFPEGRPLGPGDGTHELLTRLWTSTELPYDWNPSRAWYRNGAGVHELLRLGGFLVLTFPSPISTGVVSLLWGRGTTADSDALADLDIASFRSDVETATHIEQLNHATTLAGIPSRDFDDYLYDLGEQVALDGRRFRHRRRCLSALERDYTTASSVPLDLAEPDAWVEVWRIYDRWAAERVPGPTIDAERRGLARSLDGGDGIGMRGVGFEVDGTLRGFAVFDVLGTTSTGHFMKADRDSDIMAGTMHALFTAAHDQGATVMNIGYDGGLAGLRASKELLKPHRMLPTVWLTY